MRKASTHQTTTRKGVKERQSDTFLLGGVRVLLTTHCGLVRGNILVVLLVQMTSVTHQEHNTTSLAVVVTAGSSASSPSSYSMCTASWP